jgi:hypothetical protein
VHSSFYPFLFSKFLKFSIESDFLKDPDSSIGYFSKSLNFESLKDFLKQINVYNALFLL